MANPSQTAGALQLTTSGLFWQIISTFLSLNTLARQPAELPTMNPNSLRHFKRSAGQCEFDPTVKLELRDLLVRIEVTFSARVSKAKAMLTALPMREDLEEGEIDVEVEKCANMEEMVEWLHVNLGLAALEISRELQ